MDNEESHSADLDSNEDENEDQLGYVLIKKEELTGSILQIRNDGSGLPLSTTPSAPEEASMTASTTSVPSSDDDSMDEDSDQFSQEQLFKGTLGNANTPVQMALCALRKVEILANQQHDLSSSFDRAACSMSDLTVILESLNNVLDIAFDERQSMRQQVNMKSIQISKLKDEHQVLKTNLEMTKYHVQEVAKDVSAYEEESKRIRTLLSFPNEKLYYDCNPVVRVIQNEKFVSGVAATSKRIFVALLRDPDIRVYDLETLQPQPSISVPGLRQAEDLALCRRNIALYISDQDCIHRVDILSQDMARWDNLEGSPRGLSVTSDDSVLAVLCYEHDPSRGMIAEFSSTGEVKRCFEMGKRITFPWRAVELSGGNLVVCHGSQLGLPDGFRNSLHGVSLLDSGGQAIGEIAEGSGVNGIRVNCPISLVVDEIRGTILLADREDHKIRIFDENITEMATLDFKADLVQPYRLCFHQPSGLLCIGENRGRILLVTINPPLL